jgi:hypothetical protein
MRRLEGELRQALRSASEEADASGAPCPCAVAERDGAPRIVRVLARTGNCLGKHRGEGPGAANQAAGASRGPSRSHA